MEKGEAKAKVTALIGEIDLAELAVRLIERGCHMKRQPGMAGSDAWQEIRKAAEEGLVPAYIVDDFEAMALIAISYFGECLAAARQPN